MNDKAFVDTNVFIYLYSADEKEKKQCAQAAIEKYDCTTSTQALNEFSNVCTRKWKLPTEDIQQALDIHAKYGYSYYDCLMLSSALESQSDYLLTEDMADGQIIEDRLRIVNIFAAK